MPIKTLEDKNLALQDLIIVRRTGQIDRTMKFDYNKCDCGEIEKCRIQVRRMLSVCVDTDRWPVLRMSDKNQQKEE